MNTFKIFLEIKKSVIFINNRGILSLNIEDSTTYIDIPTMIKKYSYIISLFISKFCGKNDSVNQRDVKSFDDILIDSFFTTS